MPYITYILFRLVGKLPVSVMNGILKFARIFIPQGDTKSTVNEILIILNGPPRNLITVRRMTNETPKDELIVFFRDMYTSTDKVSKKLDKILGS